MIRKILIFIVVASLILLGHVQYVYSPEAKEIPILPLVESATSTDEEINIPPQEVPEEIYGEGIICTDDCPLIDPETGF